MTPRLIKIAFDTYVKGYFRRVVLHFNFYISLEMRAGFECVANETSTFESDDNYFRKKHFLARRIARSFIRYTNYS